MTTILDILRQLGIGRNYCGFRAAVMAIELALEDEDRLLCVKRDIYGAIAERTGVSVTAVERNLRTVIRRAWQVNPELLNHMAGYPLKHAPSVCAFIEIVSGYLERQAVSGSPPSTFQA